MSYIRHPHFEKHEVKPDIAKPLNSPKKKKLNLPDSLPDALVKILEEGKPISVPWLQWKLRMSYDESVKLKKTVEEYLNEH